MSGTYNTIEDLIHYINSSKESDVPTPVVIDSNTIQLSNRNKTDIYFWTNDLTMIKNRFSKEIINNLTRKNTIIILANPDLKLGGNDRYELRAILNSVPGLHVILADADKYREHVQITYVSPAVVESIRESEIKIGTTEARLFSRRVLSLGEPTLTTICIGLNVVMVLDNKAVVLVEVKKLESIKDSWFTPYELDVLNRCELGALIVPVSGKLAPIKGLPSVYIYRKSGEYVYDKDLFDDIVRVGCEQRVGDLLGEQLVRLG